MYNQLYIAQLDPLPEEWKKTEIRALRKLVPGPGNWCTARDLHLLKAGYHFPKSFPDLEATALACKMRVYHFENMAHGGLKVFRRLDNLKKEVAENPWLGRAVRWKGWLESSFLQQLQSARDECASKGITHKDTLQAASGGAPRPWTLPTWLKIRRDYQKTVRTSLQGDVTAEVQARLRKRLDRFPSTTFPRIKTQRAMQVLTRLEKLVPPRVHASILRTWWNGWLTARRFQLTTSADRCCIFGCAGGGDDSLEHYASCAEVWKFSKKYLGRAAPPGPPTARREAFLLLQPRQEDRGLAQDALRVAAVYAVLNKVRNIQPPPSHETTREMLPQALKEACQGHPFATKAASFTLHIKHHNYTHPASYLS